MQLYATQGLKITNLHANNEFKCTQEALLPANLNVTAANKHVGEVEQSIQTVKEISHSTIQGLPYKRYPCLLMSSMIRWCVAWLNMLPTKNGVSEQLCPRTIMTGRPGVNYDVECRVEFDAYVQVHEENNPTITTKAQATGAIAMHAVGNEQGLFYFMSLTTGKRLNHRAWTELPITSDIIKAVEKMAKDEKQPLIDGTPKFKWRPNVPFVCNNNRHGDDG